jgi:choice-of-anchor C domain-containing protein
VGSLLVDVERICAALSRQVWGLFGKGMINVRRSKSRGRVGLLGMAMVAALAGLGGVTTATPAAATSVFQDGFENPVATAGSFDAYFAGQQMGVWTVTRDDVHLIGAGFWQSAEGLQSLDLDGGLNGAIKTSINITPLISYKVSYALAGNPASGPTIKTGKVLVNGNVAQSFSFDITGKSLSNMGYVRKSFLILLTTSSKLNLEFSSTTNPTGFGPVLDDVRVESCLLVLCHGHPAVWS